MISSDEDEPQPPARKTTALLVSVPELDSRQANSSPTRLPVTKTASGVSILMSPTAKSDFTGHRETPLMDAADDDDEEESVPKQVEELVPDVAEMRLDIGEHGDSRVAVESTPERAVASTPSAGSSGSHRASSDAEIPATPDDGRSSPEAGALASMEDAITDMHIQNAPALISAPVSAPASAPVSSPAPAPVASPASVTAAATIPAPRPQQYSRGKRTAGPFGALLHYLHNPEARRAAALAGSSIKAEPQSSQLAPSVSRVADEPHSLPALEPSPTYPPAPPKHVPAQEPTTPPLLAPPPRQSAEHYLQRDKEWGLDGSVFERMGMRTMPAKEKPQLAVVTSAPAVKPAPPGMLYRSPIDGDANSMIHSPTDRARDPEDTFAFTEEA
jgi:hypothetical protein